jgi:hypothetical protein
MTDAPSRPPPFETARRIWGERYPSSRAVFCAGSVIRGEGFALSDLDLVVVFDQLPNAWRESFRFDGWPIEVFAHDSETLAYFIAQDQTVARPALAQMIAEARVVPESTPWSDRLQSWAKALVATPPAASEKAITDGRYWITDLLDDFRDERPRAELLAIACKLQPLVYNFSLKARGHWQGSGKTLPRLLQRVAPDLAMLLEGAFETFFRTGDRAPLLLAVQQALAPFGGELFDGYRSDAPATLRVSSDQIPWR